MMRTYFILLLLFQFIFNILCAQGGWTVYNTTNSGIAYDHITCIYVTKDNKKWIGTEYGVASFDGTNWQVYRTTNSDLPGDAIRSITEGANGEIWIGTFLNGLARFDGANWTTYNLSNSGLADNYIRSLIYNEIDGNLWIGTTGGLHAFDGNTWTIYDTNNSPLLSNNFPSLAIDSSNIVWAGTINGGLAKVENGSITIYNKANSNLLDNTILDISIDNAQNKWLATPSGGLNILTPGENWSIFLTVNTGLISNGLSSIGRLEGCTYIGTQDAGIQEFGSWATYDTSNSPIPDDVITDFAVEGDSVLWIGTPGSGLARFSVDCMLTSGEQVSEQLSDFEVFPNPASDITTLNFSLSKPNRVKIELMQSSGIKYCVYGGLLESGENSLEIDLNGILPGFYVLLLTTSESVYPKKLIKVNF